MRARTFMQVSIGILALAAAYHLGASSAGAQASGTVDAAYVYAGFPPYYSAAISGRQFYYKGVATGPPMPGSARAIALWQASGGEGSYTAVLDNGDMWAIYVNTPTWNYVGNVIGAAPTPAQSTSFGALKVKYR